MRALSKLIYVNSPDLVLFVGEALVGNDAVDQLSKFNQVTSSFFLIQLNYYPCYLYVIRFDWFLILEFVQKLGDLSPSPSPRLIDGILLTKFDTIDDKVRSLRHILSFHTR